MPHAPIAPEFLNYLMTEALNEASRAESANEVPVGAVIAHNGQIIARGHNTTEADNTVIAHAELHAINAATKVFGNWRLTECILCVTLEPCTMCLGAIRLSRIPTLVFGSSDSRQGAVGSLYDLSQDKRTGEPLRVIRNVQRDECQQALSRFFTNLRSE